MWDYTAFLSLVLLSHILTRCLIFGLTLQDTFLKSDYYLRHVKKAGTAFLNYIQVKDSISDVISIKTVTQSTSFADADEYNGIYQKENKMPAFTFSPFHWKHDIQMKRISVWFIWHRVFFSFSRMFSKFWEKRWMVMKIWCEVTVRVCHKWLNITKIDT